MSKDIEKEKTKEAVRQLSNEELAAFCSQLSMLNKSAITPLESMRILMTDTKDPGSLALLTAIHDYILDGDNLSEALEKTKVFPNYVVKTIRLGEESGSIDDILVSLAEYYEREVEIHDSIKNAVAYPAVMIFMMFLVIMVLVTKVLPIFNQVFVQLGAEMSGFAASLLKIGESLNRYSVGIVSLIALLIVIYFVATKTAFGKRISKRILEKFFLTKSFYEDVATERFASGMTLVLKAGIDTYRGLDMINELVEHENISKKIEICKEEIMNQESLPDSLKKAQFFSNLNNRLVDVGFKSGEREEAMKRIADEYRRKSERKMNTIVSIIEPTLVIILSIIVGLILLSVILPLMGIMSNIG
ncbi:MAG: type II secretion system F family protein [Lachnospiraceae bacterium]|nr:type II secretion system F family protein [Lachnospiraceae bacterium]